MTDSHLLFLIFVLLYAGFSLGQKIVVTRLKWLAYIVPMFFFVVMALGSHGTVWIATTPLKWFVAGRFDILLFALSVGGIMSFIAARAIPMRSKVLLFVFFALGLCRFSILPVVSTMRAQEEVSQLTTTFDENNVCLQSTSYTCVPCATLTCLKARNVTADEATLARKVHANPMTGASYLDMVEVLNDEILPAGLSCQLVKYASLENVKALPVIGAIKWAPMIDHAVALMEITPTHVVVGDPLHGLTRYSHQAFKEVWRPYGIEVVAAKMPE